MFSLLRNLTFIFFISFLFSSCYDDGTLGYIPAPGNTDTATVEENTSTSEETADENSVNSEIAARLIAESMSRVDWEIVKDTLLEICDESQSRKPFSIIPPIPIFNSGGLTIGLQPAISGLEVGALLTFTYDDFTMLVPFQGNRDFSGTMYAFITPHNIFNLTMKIAIFTEDDPLTSPFVSLFPPILKIVIEFDDIELYYSIPDGNFVTDPPPNGNIILTLTTYILGVPVPVTTTFPINEAWINLLIFIMNLF